MALSAAKIASIESPPVAKGFFSNITKWEFKAVPTCNASKNRFPHMYRWISVILCLLTYIVQVSKTTSDTHGHRVSRKWNQ